MWEYKIMTGSNITANLLNEWTKNGWRLHTFIYGSDTSPMFCIYEREIINAVYLALDPDGKEIIFDPQNRLKTDDKKTE